MRSIIRPGCNHRANIPRSRGIGFDITRQALQGTFPACSTALEPPTSIFEGHRIDVISMFSPLLMTLYQSRAFECPHMARHRLPCDRQDGSELANRDLGT